MGAHCLHPLVAGCNSTTCSFVCLYFCVHNVCLCVCVLIWSQSKNVLPQVRAQCWVFVWGGHPASAAYPDKDRRPGLQLEVFALAKSNIVHFSERAGPSLGLEPPGDEGGRRPVESREKNNSISVRKKMSPKEQIHQHVTLRLLLSSRTQPDFFKPWVDFQITEHHCFSHWCICVYLHIQASIERK